MKRYIFLLAGFVFLFAGTGTVHAQSLPPATESISSYMVSLRLASSGVLHVSEDILYNFGSNEKHGIFRTIPISSGGWPDLVITNVGVLDPKVDTPYFFTNLETSGNLEIKIGDANVLLSGTREYQINYDVQNAIRSFPDHDELYWNAIGAEWSVPIGQAAALIIVPSSIPSSSISTYCYAGPEGSQSQSCGVTSNLQDDILVSVPFGLPANNGLTISVSMPKGYISNTVEKSATSWLSAFLSNGPLIPSVVWGIFIIIGVFGAIRAKTKRAIIPKELKHVPIAPFYEPPDGLSPAVIGYAENRVFDTSDFTSIVLDLAVRGFLKITYIPKNGFLSSEDYELTALKAYESGLPLEYKPVYNFFFADGTTTVRINSLDQGLGVDALGDANDLVAKTFDQAGYATKSKAGAFGWFLLVLFIGGIVGAFINFFILFGCFALFFLCIFIGAAKYGQKFTPKGIELMKKVLGYKLFLTFTAQKRLELMDAPKLSPEDFEKTLPYAIALGIEKQWAQQFESLTIPSPCWLEDSRYGNGFNAGVFVGSFGSFTSRLGSSVTPSGSGSGGGGSVGGGGGGGGGGSW